MKANRLLTVLSIHVGILLFGMALDTSAQQVSATANGQMSMSTAKMKRALAKNIIKAQKEEIAFMKRWQARHDTNM
jgi:uncharacterized protein (DUF305 family)